MLSQRTPVLSAGCGCLTLRVFSECAEVLPGLWDGERGPQTPVREAEEGRRLSTSRPQRGAVEVGPGRKTPWSDNRPSNSAQTWAGNCPGS